MATIFSCDVCNSVKNVKKEKFVISHTKYGDDIFIIDVCDSCYRKVIKEVLKKQDRSNIQITKCFEEALKSNGISFQI